MKSFKCVCTWRKYNDCITGRRTYAEEEGKKKPPEISITGNKITQDPENQGKKSKVDSIIDGKKIYVELKPPPNTN